jgi:hypothetical protein
VTSVAALAAVLPPLAVETVDDQVENRSYLVEPNWPEIVVTVLAVIALVGLVVVLLRTRRARSRR